MNISIFFPQVCTLKTDIPGVNVFSIRGVFGCSFPFLRTYPPPKTMECFFSFHFLFKTQKGETGGEDGDLMIIFFWGKITIFT